MESLFSLEETADRLGLPVRSVRRLVKDGHLKALYPLGKSKKEPPRFRPEEVAALAELRSQKLGLAEIAALAKSASIKVSVLERRLERLLELVGADIPALDYSEEGVLKLRAEMQLLISDKLPIINAGLLFQWAQRFYAMGPEYFAAVQNHCQDNEPWHLPLKLSTKLYSLRPQLVKDPELETAYRYLDAGRRFMRQAAYFYVREQLGSRMANRLFREVDGNIHQRILSMVFTAQN